MNLRIHVAILDVEVLILHGLFQVINRNLFCRFQVPKLSNFDKIPIRNTLDFFLLLSATTAGIVAVTCNCDLKILPILHVT